MAVSPGCAERRPRQVLEQVGGVGVDTVSTGALEFVTAVAGRQQPDPQSAGAAGREQIPGAVPDHEGVAHIGADEVGGGQEQIGIGLGVTHLVAGDQRGVGRQPKHVKRRLWADHVRWRRSPKPSGASG